MYGKYWCWVFWELRVPTVDILRAPELRCRAVDSSNNSQPEGYAAAPHGAHAHRAQHVTQHLCEAERLLERHGS